MKSALEHYLCIPSHWTGANWRMKFIWWPVGVGGGWWVDTSYSAQCFELARPCWSLKVLECKVGRMAIWNTLNFKKVVGYFSYRFRNKAFKQLKFIFKRLHWHWNTKTGRGLPRESASFSKKKSSNLTGNINQNNNNWANLMCFKEFWIKYSPKQIILNKHL